MGKISSVERFTDHEKRAIRGRKKLKNQNNTVIWVKFPKNEHSQ